MEGRERPPIRPLPADRFESTDYGQPQVHHNHVRREELRGEEHPVAVRNSLGEPTACSHAPGVHFAGVLVVIHDEDARS